MRGLIMRLSMRAQRRLIGQLRRAGSPLMVGALRCFKRVVFCVAAAAV